MNARTNVSAAGEVVVPKGLSEQLGWAPGTTVDIFAAAGEIGIRRVPPPKTLSFEEATARLRATAGYKGRYYSEAEWDQALEEMFRTREP